MKHPLLRLTLAITLAGAIAARADAVLDWNAIASQTILAGGRPGPSFILDFAVVQGAVHDAVQAYDQRFEPYATDIPGASGSPVAAVAKTTRDVLVNRFPAQAASVHATYLAYLAAKGLDETDPGVLVGQQAAAGMIVLRAGDGSFPNPAPPNFVGANLPGVWRPTPSYLPGGPPSFAPMAVPWVGEVTCFTLLSSSQFRAQAPPALTSSQYEQDYNEVKALGSLNSTERTPEQTQAARFWSDNLPAQWNRALRSVAEAHLDNMGDTARLFALAWLASTDAFITTWETKKHYAFWRPVTAIQEGENDGNPDTIGDATWQPLINTPNYPDQSSGANAVTAAMTRSLALFFGTDWVTFTVTSNHPLASPNTRTYERFSDAADEVVEARIYQGIHFRFADIDGRKVGKHAANWTFENALRPIQGDEDEDHDDQD
ncbi:MAG TPA: vanadium-dependent haloperoxidase [Verrucomicrobiae bacterium]|nr:vanadium-dependent haloperoxidase [Verrucomicrobiae bacterium]